MPSVTRRLVRAYLPERVRRQAHKVRSRAGSAVGRSPAGDRPSTRSVGGESDPLLAALRSGGSLTDGLVAEVRSRLADGDVVGATSIAAALKRDVATVSVGSLCSGLVAFERGYQQLAWHELSHTPPELWARHAPGEFVRSGVSEDYDAVMAAVRALVDGPPPALTPRLWLDILEPVYGAGERDLADRIFRTLDERIGRVGSGSRVAVRRDWMERWIHRVDDSPTAPAPGGLSFAVMDYDHPGRSRASANIGDHVQTLASLGHLVRHQDLAYTGPQDLVDLVGQLRSRVRPDKQRHGQATEVSLMTVDRDATMYSAIPERTWTLAFGWYMHALFGIRYGFPFHRNLLPIFVSFHCNKRELLTEEAIAYLRDNGPIGCRDWTTVDILLSVDVPAFFSGCMTTTVNTVFPDLVGAPPADAPVAYVDVPSDRLPQGAVVYKHSSDDVRFRSFTANMFTAVDLLETYRRDHSAVVTSRLHCYLPMRSLGSSVDFQPKNRSDIRFAGLIDITDDAFHAIQRGINDKLQQIFDLILSGAEPPEVYARWRELTGPEVESARRRLAATATSPAHSTDVGPEVDRAVAATRTVNASVATAGDVVDVVVEVRRSAPQVLRVFLDSLVAGTERPVHVRLLTRNGVDIDLDALGLRFPSTSLSVVPTDGLGADLRLVDGGHGRVEGLATVLLPRLLPNTGRAVVLPFTAVTRGDVAELADLDLGSCALAAPDVSSGGSGFGVIHSAGNRLGTRTTVSTELRRQAHARHAFDFSAFDDDVLVMDLARLRSGGMLDDAVSLVEEFGLNGREVLHLAFGPHRAAVPARWHVVPTRSAADQPALVHWKDEAKPWGQDYAPLQELWFEGRQAFRARTRAPRTA